MSTTPIQRLVLRLAPWTLPLLLLGVWQLTASSGWLSSRILPAPSAVAVAGWALLTSGELWQHLAISGWRAGIGFAIGGGLGCHQAAQQFAFAQEMLLPDKLVEPLRPHAGRQGLGAFQVALLHRIKQ